MPPTAFPHHSPRPKYPPKTFSGHRTSCSAPQFHRTNHPVTKQLSREHKLAILKKQQLAINSIKFNRKVATTLFL